MFNPLRLNASDLGGVSYPLHRRKSRLRTIQHAPRPRMQGYGCRYGQGRNGRGNDHGAARKIHQGIFRRAMFPRPNRWSVRPTTKRCRLISKGTPYAHGCVHRPTAGSRRFLLIPTLKVKGRTIGAAVHLGITQLNDLCTTRNRFPYGVFVQ